MASEPGSSPREQPKKKLTKFEGRDVHSTTVSITNAGDGLSKAMKVEPTELHHEQTVHVVLECVVSKIRYDQVDDTDGLQRVHVLKAGRATIIDAALVKAALDEQETKIDEALGNMKLAFTDDQIDGLMAAHDAGLHEGITEDGCPSCAERDALAEAEKDAGNGDEVGAQRKSRSAAKKQS